MITTWLIRLFAWLVLAYLMFPLVVIVGSSLTTGAFLDFPPKGVTLAWYAQILREPGYVASYITSTVLAAASTAMALVLTVPACIALARHNFPGKRLLHSLLTAPLVLPHIVLGAALLQFGSGFGLSRNFAALLIGHTIIIAPFVLQSVLPMFSAEQRSFEEASQDLGATPWQTFRFVVFPQIRPGIVTGSVFAFISSWINVEMSIFNTTAHLSTLPVKLFNYVQYTIDPTIAAVSGATILVAAIAIVLLELTVGLDILAESN